MKFNIIILILLTLFLASCEKSEKSERSMEKTEEQSEHESSELAELTQEQMDAVGISLGQIEMKELTSIVKANGALSVPNNNKASATSLYGGVIKTLNVQVGDYVKKGQVIATIANPEFIQLQEDYLTIGSRIIFAEQEYKRQRELFDNDAGAKKNLQNADAELKTLRTKRASLQRQIQMMGISPGSVSNKNLRSGLAVTAPISGTISTILLQIGSYIDVSSPVAEIVDNSSLHLDLQVFEKDLPLIKVGQKIHFTLTNNPVVEYDAEVYSIGTAFENQSKTIPIHCKVKGNKNGLIDGMNATAVVSLDNKLMSAVPNTAITSADGKDYIFLVSDKKAENHKDVKSEEKHNEKTINFERIEVVKGTSEMGYTAITPVKSIPESAKIATKGAFFINAKLTNSGEHEH
ncbi:RND family efflux transporter, MFP subunit [Chryseobacterium piscicola]|uniref:Efflux transporter periplasmic adaptor subunit n=1 Tax=Chryseobacterium piscicola TaxID=551459 RepID=A0A1N7KFU6_9FLAO|nr:efflux RND transporter periplasmic adaptor subunit [Chryseobacterium piscicola]PQA96323.1 efflux transporter periplasmic adaptor subunit [Chryseobacterium piscicola]SIS60437.1 RND family efflux transporter, MFP subunit [Chryseobacterium piscicola]